MDAIAAGLVSTAIIAALLVRLDRKPVAEALRETVPFVAAVTVGIVGGQWLDDTLFGGTKVVSAVSLIVVVAFLTWSAVRRTGTRTSWR